MKIINRIVESMMTADEQVELMRLEDEVAQARDEVEFCQEEYKNSRDWQTGLEIETDLKLSRIVFNRTENNLNKYIDSITKEVMARI